MQGRRWLRVTGALATSPWLPELSDEPKHSSGGELLAKAIRRGSRSRFEAPSRPPRAMGHAPTGAHPLCRSIADQPSRKR